MERKKEVRPVPSKKLVELAFLASKHIFYPGRGLWVEVLEVRVDSGIKIQRKSWRWERGLELQLLSK